MHCLILALSMMGEPAAAPTPENPEPGPEPGTALRYPLPDPRDVEAERARAQAERAREAGIPRKAKLAFALTGVYFGLGAGIQWLAAGVTDHLTPGENATRFPYVFASSWGTAFMTASTFGAAIGPDLLARPWPRDRRRSRVLRGIGGAVTAVGLAGALGTGLLWPQISERCPIREGCGLIGLQLGMAHIGAGFGMLSYGSVINPDRRQRLPDWGVASLALGGTALITGYVGAAFFGMRSWTGRDDEVVGRRLRNQMLIPFAGPFIVAAGPDVNLGLAALSVGLGVAQVTGGAVLIGGGIGLAATRRTRRKAQITVLPTGTGLSIHGRF